MATVPEMKLGLSIKGLGYHTGAWRHPDVPPGGGMDIGYYTRLAQLAERGKFDMVFLADGIAVRGRDEPTGSLCRSAMIVDLEPLTLLSALAMVTKRIGLVATASTTYNEPYHVARKFASLDHISGGRAGWNVVTSWSEAEAWNFNREHHLEKTTRYERAAEFVDVVRGLWNSWEDDAFVHDKAEGLYYDPAKLHVLNHKGTHFSVRGPLNVARPLQGHPVIVQAGESEQGQEIAAASADVVFVAQQDFAKAKAFYSSVKGKMAKYGRPPEAMKILPGLLPIVGRTEQEAQDKLRFLEDLIHPLAGLAQLYALAGDLSAYPLDGPVPDFAAPETRMRSQHTLEMARRENLTIRQLYKRVCNGRSHRVVIGTPQHIADEMEYWVRNGAADGYNIVPPYTPGSVEDFIELVTPELRRRGLFRTEYEGTTLRDNLGVRRPPHPAAVRPGQRVQA